MTPAQLRVVIKPRKTGEGDLSRRRFACMERMSPVEDEGRKGENVRVHGYTAFTSHTVTILTRCAQNTQKGSMWRRNASLSKRQP